MKSAFVKRVIAVFLILVLAAGLVFLTGRYGWKLVGFNACETTGIEQINVEEDHVRIRGFYPGSFPTGFLGYHAEQVDHTLYVGFKFTHCLEFLKREILISPFPQRELSRRS